VGAGRRVTANAGPLHVNTVPSHSVTCTRQFQVPAVRYDGVAMLALVVRAPDDRTVALDSVVKEPPEPACTCTRAVPFCSSVLPSDQVNPAASVPVPNTTPLAVHDAPALQDIEIGALVDVQDLSLRGLPALEALRLPLLVLLLAFYSVGYLLVGVISGTLDRSNANFGKHLLTI
jgi:hypothetical protein